MEMWMLEQTLGSYWRTLVCALLATGYYRGLRFPEWWILEQSNVDNLSGLQRVVNHLCCKTPNI